MILQDTSDMAPQFRHLNEAKSAGDDAALQAQNLWISSSECQGFNRNWG